VSAWMQAVRIRFLLSSIIAVASGLSIAYWKYKEIDLFYASMTFAGVICLHASIDLLNDYWDYKKGIDTITRRTKFSGGTGVLPQNLLKPKDVYYAGVILLLIGTLIGAYFALVRGIIILAFVGFAVLAVYFYTTNIVNLGLGETFVAIKGTLIVVGSYYIQTSSIGISSVYAGIIIGILSATVLFVNSFPDYEADRIGGRKTLVILLGKQRAARIFPGIVLCTYSLIIAGALLGYLKIYSLASMVSLPFAIAAMRGINNPGQVSKLVRVMGSTVTYSRLTGIVLTTSFLF
jgi:1,4-dihydroxy-2-naphthoate polyprenyltransferase